MFCGTPRKPIISSPFRPPSRQHVLTTAFLTALADKDRELPPFLFIGEDEGVCCSLEHSGLWFLVGIESEGTWPRTRGANASLLIGTTAHFPGNCLAAYRFLEIFLRALELYLGEVRQSCDCLGAILATGGDIGKEGTRRVGR